MAVSKIAMYIDPYISAISTFYTHILLKHEFEQLGYVFDIFIPDWHLIKTGNNDCWLNKEYSEKHNYMINWGFPDPMSYDALIVIHIWSKKWYNGVDVRKNVAEKFQQHHKKVICIKVDTTLEHRYLNDQTVYGIISNNTLNIDSRWILPKNAKTFIMPVLANLSFPKPNAMPKNDFYDKYGLNRTRKLIIFFMPRYMKWVENPKLDSRSVVWILTHYNELKTLLNTLNYELIFKLHKSDGTSIIQKYSLDTLPIIDPYDTYEAIKYADRAITYGTTMVYELYLYKLPVIELYNGHCLPFPGWISYTARGLSIPFNGGCDLIYGKIVTYDELSGDTRTVFKTFFDTTFNINDFKYKTDHPVYQNCYGTSIQDVVQSILTQL